MKTIDAGGITYIEPVPGGTPDWYYGISREHGDLYEAEELFRQGRPVRGNTLCLVHYPDGSVYQPLQKQEGTYFDRPVYLNGQIFLLQADFPGGVIRIFSFSCQSHETALLVSLPLAAVRNCYNLMLHISPLCLTRQGNDDWFEIIWPEQVRFEIQPRESFFLRQGDRLYFNAWLEEGEGDDYRYWEETHIRNLQGELTEILPGDVRIMPNGEMWFLISERQQ